MKTNTELLEGLEYCFAPMCSEKYHLHACHLEEALAIRQKEILEMIKNFDHDFDSYLEIGKTKIWSMGNDLVCEAVQSLVLDRLKKQIENK